jgi:phage terminase large subunit-like protein
MLSRLPREARARLADDFAALSLRHQVPPRLGPDGAPWTTWLILGGRGAGKTRTGAEWVRGIVHATPPYAEHAYLRIALVGETEHDAREVMVEGPSGILQVSPAWQRPLWIPSRKRLEWANGAVAQVFSAEDPDSLRGPEFDAAWCDEIAKWRLAHKAFDNLQFGLRLGALPRQVVTTTPRPIPLIKKLVKDPRTLVTRAPTIANKELLSPAFLDAVVARYRDTRLGRQELDGEIIDDRADALWSPELIEKCRVEAAPPLINGIVIGVDPPGSSRPGAAACGIVAAGMSEEDVIYVIKDASVAGLSPAGWASRVAALYRALGANYVVAETNMGGEMVRATIQSVDRYVRVHEVSAGPGKWHRAAPIAALYEQGKVRHVGYFPDLEDEMCDFASDGLSGGRSPDRMDAMVWAAKTLWDGAARCPRIRRL